MNPCGVAFATQLRRVGVAFSGHRRGRLVEAFSPTAVARGFGEGGEKAKSEEEEDGLPRSPIYSQGGVTGALARLSCNVGQIGRG